MTSRTGPFRRWLRAGADVAYYECTAVKVLDARKPLTVLCVFDERVKSDVSDLSFVRSLMFLVPTGEQARHSVAHQPCYPPSRTPLYSPHLHCSHSATAGQLFTFVPSPEAQQSAISRLYHRPPPERRPLEPLGVDYVFAAREILYD